MSITIGNTQEWQDTDGSIYTVTLTLRDDQNGSKMVLIGFGVHSESGTEITVEVYRRIPVMQLVRKALEVILGEPNLATTNVGAQRGASLSEDVLAEVARIYKETVARNLPPIPAIAEAFNISKSTSAKRVMLARKFGFLGKARKGKSG